MNTGNHQLVELIRSTIVRDGPVSFAWFMEQALYHPEHGYYSSGRARLGRAGDYFTNVNVGPLFGELLALQFTEFWTQLDQPKQYVLVEQGAHEGQLANDVLSALRNISPACFGRLQYHIIEPSSILRERQQQRLKQFSDQVAWFTALDEMEPFVGAHFSNELLDAFPVHLVRANQHEGTPGHGGTVRWMETVVDWENDQFVFIQQPISDPQLQEYVRELPPLAFRSAVEVNLAALHWIDNLSAKLRRGLVLIMDYGVVENQLSAAHRRGGTVQCRAGHRIVSSPFSDLGNCDITAHVNWSDLARRAMKHQLDIAGFTDQHHFLTGIISAYSEFADSTDPKRRRQLQTLLHPEMMGQSFQVLGLRRGIKADKISSGFNFVRPNWRDTLIGQWR